MSKISELSDGGSLQPTDFLIAVRSGANVKVQADQTEFDRIRLGDNEKIELGNSQDMELYFSGSGGFINNTTGDLTVDVAGNITLDADGNNITLKDGGTDYGNFTKSSNDFVVQSTISDGDILFKGNDGGSATTMLTLNASEGGAATFNSSVSAAALTVSNANGATLNVNTAGGGVDAKILLHETATATSEYGASLKYSGANNRFEIGTGQDPETKRLSIDRDTGDISFYEDTGTTAKLFWDASAESLGLGVTNPSKTLDVEGAIRAKNSAGTSGAEVDVTSGATWRLRSNPISGTNNYGLDIIKGSAGTDVKMSIDSSGGVGINDTDPANGKLTIRATSTTGTKNGHIMLTGDSATVGEGPQIAFSESGISSNWVGATIGFTRTGGSGVGDLLFSTRQSAGDADTTATEVMRLTSAGNFLVDNTVANPASGYASQKGFGYEGSTGKTEIATTADQPVMQIGKNHTNDGDIVVLRKQANTIGSLGVSSGDNLFISGTTGHAGLQFSSNQIAPMVNGVDTDATVSLGVSSSRFANLWLSGEASVPTLTGVTTINTASSTGVLELYGGATNKGGKILLSGGNNTSDGADIRFHSGASTTTPLERMRLQQDGILHITSAAEAIVPTIIHSGATGALAKLRVINRNGQGANKGGLLELGGVTNDEVTRSDVFASVAGLKTNGNSNVRTGYLQLSTSDGATLQERARITDDGTLLVGKTALDNSTVGARINANGDASFVAASTTPLIVNRKTNNGEILQLKQDAHVRGSIGTNSYSLPYFINPGSGGGGIGLGEGASIIPVNNTGTFVDATKDIGTNAFRFKDVWISNAIKATSTIAVSVPVNSGAAIQMEFGNNDNTVRRTAQFYKDMLRPADADDGDLSLGDSTHRWKDLHLSGAANLGYFAKIGGGTSSQTVGLLVDHGSSTSYNLMQAENDNGTWFSVAGDGVATFGGNLQVGTTSTPSATQSGFLFTGDQLYTSAGSSTTTNYQVRFYNGNGLVGAITTDGSATAYLTSSDYRLKENVVELSGATERLKQLKPSRFNFIADADKTVDGFLAHEVQDIVPEAITGAKDAMMDEEYEVTPAVLDDDGNVVTEAVMGTRSVPDYQGIDQSKLVPLLVATIQELEARISALES